MKPSSTPNFDQTLWTQIIDPSKDRNHHDYIRASNQLCKDYDPLIYGYIRKTGRSHEDAKDLTQEFFARAFGERNLISKADKSKGRFRTFAIACVKNLLRDAYKAETRQKRNYRNLVHLDSLGEYDAGDKNDLTPDQHFEYTLAREVFRNIRTEFETYLRDTGKFELFQSLKPWVYGSDDAPSYAELSDQLGIPVGSLLSTTHRMKRRFRVIRDQHFQRIVADPNDIPDEIMAFQNALRVARHML